MKFILIALSLVVTPVFAQTVKEQSGWAIMAGRGELADGKKQANDLDPSGTTFKATWTTRTKFIDGGLMARYGKLTDELKYSSIDGDFSQTDLTLGVFGSFWVFSHFNLHAGYGLHFIRESVTGDFSETQKTEIQDKYDIRDRESIYGVYGGADLVLAQTKDFQFFLNYDYFHLNGLKAHQWEAMAGIKLYLGPSKVGKGNFFVKMFTELFSPKDSR